MPGVNPRQFYEHLLLTMPDGIEKIVLRLLSFHVGLYQAIQKKDLIDACARSGNDLHERQLRLVIVRLRKAGVPVCASSGESGYYLASSLEEYMEFRGREYVKKIMDMRDTVNAMDTQIRQLFSDDYQIYKQQQTAAAGQPRLF